MPRDGGGAREESGDATATAEDKIIVEKPTLDLDAYAGSYTDRTRARRLAFIAEHCPSLRIEALRLLVGDMWKDGNLGTMQPVKRAETAKRLAELCVESGLPFDPIPSDEEVKAAAVKLNTQFEKLDADFKKAKTHMVKETIRLSLNELGDHYYGTGSLSAAHKMYAKTRDYNTTTNQVTDMCFNVIKVAIELQNWSMVHQFITKAEAEARGEFAASDAAKVKSLTGLAHLASHQYENAARAFLEVNFEHSSAFPDVMTARDIGIYGGLCALATYNRKKIKESVLENTSFKEFLELAPEVRELIKDFYASRYSSCLQILDRMKSDLLLDLFLQQHVPFLFREIRKKALVQYFSPFRSVDMKIMATSFSCGIDELETELIDLISGGSIQARIDSDQKILYARTVNQRTKTFADAIEVGRVYQVHSKAMLLRVAMMKANLSVRNRERMRAGGMDMPDGIGGGMGHEMMGMGGGMMGMLSMMGGR